MAFLRRITSKQHWGAFYQEYSMCMFYQLSHSDGGGGLSGQRPPVLLRALAPYPEYASA